MKKLILLLLPLLAFAFGVAQAQDGHRVKGLCIAAPGKADLDEFVLLIDTKLAPAGVNTLILRIDWDFEYESHPELRGNNPLSHADVQKLVAASQRNHIRLIPQINLLGHQSWHSTLGKLLEVYPEFDETPKIEQIGRAHV